MCGWTLQQVSCCLQMVLGTGGKFTMEAICKITLIFLLELFFSFYIIARRNNISFHDHVIIFRLYWSCIKDTSFLYWLQFLPPLILGTNHVNETIISRYSICWVDALCFCYRLGPELGFEDPNLTALVSQNLESMVKRRQITCI